MDYLILCFGRTEFTRLTVDSILRHSASKPTIKLINNGWNERLVPQPLLKVWTDFIQRYRDEGKVESVIEIENPTAGAALNGFSVATLSDERYHFITDNDCLLLPSAAGSFDAVATDAMERNPELWKLGAFLYRKVSPTYCARFASEGFDLANYLPIDWQAGERFCPRDQDMQDYADYTRTPRNIYERDTRIWMIPSDTTLSIVRNPHRVTEAHRLSPTLRAIEVLHIGYMESHFCSQTDPDANLEFIHYHLLRPKIMLQFADDYQKRGMAYLRNLRAAGFGHVVDEYKKRYLKRT